MSPPDRPPNWPRYRTWRSPSSTSNCPPWHMRIPTFALSHPLHHSSLRPPATKAPGKRTNRYSLDGRALNAARAHRTPDWQPSRAAHLQLLPRRAAGVRMTEPPPTDLLGPKHRHEPNSLTPRDGRPRLPPLRLDVKSGDNDAAAAPCHPGRGSHSESEAAAPQALEWVAFCTSSNRQQLPGSRSCRQTRQGSSEALGPNTSTPARRGAGNGCSTTPGRATEAATVPLGHSVHQ